MVDYFPILVKSAPNLVVPDYEISALPLNQVRCKQNSRPGSEAGPRDQCWANAVGVGQHRSNLGNASFFIAL